ncbi:hypothetical protein [Pelomonas sp. KK5]|uniref:hypothetical protein n=1 Tax=Pelomonas sp. KK5 TaxID=1855730 RepID=UPI00097BC1C1|nr:hypothetical protein [Pelomonas sp. KK5]
MPTRRALLMTMTLGPLAETAGAAERPLRVTYPRMLERPESAYGYQVLQLALRRSGRPAGLRLGRDLLSNKQAWQQLQDGLVDVVDNASAGRTPERVALVPAPIDMGLGGCRLLLGRREVLERLRGVRRIEELQPFVFGQGLDWTDTRILRQAGLRVQEADFPSLLRMLQGRRFDLLPLSCDEAYAFLDRGREQAPDVAIAAELGLFYPYPRVFFVSAGNTELRDTLLRGLQAAGADGSLQALLARTPGIGPVVTGRQPLPRTLIGLANPWLPEPLRGLPPEAYHPSLRPSLRALAERS